MSRAKLNHVNIATADGVAMADLYRNLLGLPVVCETVVEEQGVRVLKLDAGGTMIEITEPTGDDTPVGRFLAKRGPGLHHLAFEVDDIEKKIAEMLEAGVTMIDETARIGASGHRIAFIHPKSFGGVLVELVEVPESP